MAGTNIVAGGCDPTPMPKSGGSDVSGALGALGGLAQAAMSGNLVGALKGMAIAKGKQLATAALMKLFTVKAGPKPAKPPWTGLGKIAPPGSALAAAAMAAFNSVHAAPPASGASPPGSSSVPAAGSPTTGAATSGAAGSKAAHDPWSLGGILGKLWNLPNTLIGIAFGGLGLVVGAIGSVFDLCPMPSVGIGHNAIEFYNNPFCQWGNITIGNSTSYGPDSPVDAPRPEGPGTNGDHEEQHTYQGELLGPFYLLSNLIGGVLAEILNGSWHGPHNWNERGPLSYIAIIWRAYEEFVRESAHRHAFCLRQGLYDCKDVW